MIIPIDGLNLGNKKFLINKDFLICHTPNTDDNIAMAYVRTGGLPNPNKKDEFLVGMSKQRSSTIKRIAYFLSCFHIKNNFMPRIMKESGLSRPIPPNERLEGLTKTIFGLKTKSGFKRKPSSQTIKSLEKTKPFFDVVDKLLTNKKNRNLEISLVVYQNAVETREPTLSLLNFITAIEALISNQPDLKYKFAMRTSMLVEKNPKKRLDLYNFLTECYDTRNALVHGSEISFDFYPYLKHQKILEDVAKKALLKYVDLCQKGYHKPNIISSIDAEIIGPKGKAKM